jgi:hypothetical protein
MELDPTKLQLIFNVGMITGVTSLALINRLLKRDNHRLAVELNLRPERPLIVSEIATRNSVRSSTPPQRSANTPEAPACATAPSVQPMVRQDIRQYVSQRLQGWTVTPATKAG